MNKILLLLLIFTLTNVLRSQTTLDINDSDIKLTLPAKWKMAGDENNKGVRLVTIAREASAT
ncbi:hypothetical protein F9K33_08300 [bacterium]|nr:MAG: hypothetical protein F9K33_08300 [bacterium]